MSKSAAHPSTVSMSVGEGEGPKPSPLVGAGVSEGAETGRSTLNPRHGGLGNTVRQRGFSGQGKEAQEVREWRQGLEVQGGESRGLSGAQRGLRGMRSQNVKPASQVHCDGRRVAHRNTSCV